MIREMLWLFLVVVQLWRSLLCIAALTSISCATCQMKHQFYSYIAINRYFIVIRRYKSSKTPKGSSNSVVCRMLFCSDALSQVFSISNFENLNHFVVAVLFYNINHLTSVPW